ncbi:HD-GYP domain-containing protein [Acidaminobacter sp. JC074]|uniref:HD-GYP domain-containing protein n=1 Tax=Acidaminobacter sp. JC074 TaxID=2530199 RepID=UPI001F0DFBFF|nr:HD domain-containing phosphohydrolase [Acidaminobacter sp. JC074]
MRILVIGMILVGAIIMLISIMKYSKLFEFPLNLKNDKHSKISMMIRINFYMMFFFFIGYLITTFMLVTGIEISILLIGMIFLFGALFVFSVIFIQFELSEVINEIYSFHTVEALVNTIEAKDVYTQGHSRHVANLSVCLYEHLPKDMKKQMNPHMIRYAGFLHDIGKIGISDTILNKNGKLTDEEWEIMKTHPKIGKDIISSNVILSSIGDWILYHHERVDGKGYYGLSGDEIPLEAKIIGVADTYSALTTKRVYHTAKTHEHSIRLLKEASGHQLDTKLVNVFSTINESVLDGCIPEEMYVNKEE